MKVTVYYVTKSIGMPLGRLSCCQKGFIGAATGETVAVQGEMTLEIILWKKTVLHLVSVANVADEVVVGPGPFREWYNKIV